jgi:hypothetical protein
MKAPTKRARRGPSRPEHFYDRRGADACCPKHGGAGNPAPAAMTPWSSTFSTFTPVETSTPSLVSRLAAFRDSDSAKVGRIRAPPSSNTIRLLAGIDLAEILAQGHRDQLSYRSGKLDAGRASAHQHEGHLASAFFRSSVDSANSNALRILVRIVSASLRLLRPGANRANSS